MTKFGNLLRRCRPRFRLRTLLLAVTVLCVWLGAEVERWRGEVAALREVFVPGFCAVYVRGYWGADREINGPDDLRLWETVVRTQISVPPRRLEYIISRLPNTRNIGFSPARTAADYRALIDVQRTHRDVDVHWDFCSHFPSHRWGSNNRKLTDFEYAELDFYRLKGWDTSIMRLGESKVPLKGSAPSVKPVNRHGKIR